MSRKATWIVVVVLGLAVTAPGVVYAATGAFSSSSSATALTATNTGSGKAINASSITGYTAVFTRTGTTGTVPTLQATLYSATNGAAALYGYEASTGTGTTYGVSGRSNSRGGNASGVFGFATATTGLTNGVFGTANSIDGTGVFGVGVGDRGYGVLGLGGILGVAGVAGPVGSGTYGLYSFGDMKTEGHLVGIVGRLSGTCQVPAGNPGPIVCPFDEPFTGEPGIVPRVVITPEDDPGSVRYWISARGPTSFTISVSAAPGSAIDFTYIVVGETEAPPAAARARVAAK